MKELKANLYGLDLLPVDPIRSSPLGILFYVDYKYGTYDGESQRTSDSDVKPTIKKIINQIFSDIDPFGEEDWGS